MDRYPAYLVDRSAGFCEVQEMMMMIFIILFMKGFLYTTYQVICISAENKEY